MFDERLVAVAERVAVALKERGETVAVAEGSCGGLVSAALLSVDGASAYFLGGTVIYTASATRAYLAPVAPVPPGTRGATEAFARYLAATAAASVAATWGIGEGGAAGPTGNPYGDPPGHAWVAVARSGGDSVTRNVLTGRSDRRENMVTFATAALDLLELELRQAG